MDTESAVERYGTMVYRLAYAQQAGVPVVNYGVAIAQIHGILKRSLAPFPALQALV